MRPGQDIGDDLFVGMAQMGLAVDIINGGSHIKTFAHSPHTVGQGRKLGNWQVGEFRRPRLEIGGE